MVTEFLGHLTVTDGKPHGDLLDKGWMVPAHSTFTWFDLWDIKDLPEVRQTSDSDPPSLQSSGPSSLFLIAWSKVMTTPSTYHYWGHWTLIASWFTLYQAVQWYAASSLQAVWHSQHKGYDNSYRYRWNNWLVQTWLDAWGIFYPGGTQQIFIREDSASRSNPLPFYIPFSLR